MKEGKFVCETCDVAMTARTSTRKDPYAFPLSGVPTVCLVGVRVHRCPKCGEEIAEVPHLRDLHRMIAVLIEEKKGLLLGAEIRFLRKQAGFSAMEFAELLRINASTLSRVEADKQPLGGTADQLVRVISSVVAKADNVRKVLLAAAEQKKTRIRKPRPQLLRLARDGWRIVADAA